MNTPLRVMILNSKKPNEAIVTVYLETLEAHENKKYRIHD